MSHSANALGPACDGAEAMDNEASAARSIGARHEAPSRYGGSLWNAWLDAKMGLDLTVAEHKLADALARNVIGFGGRTTEALGNNLLRRESRLDGRSFDRARVGLAAKGLIAFSSTGKGRGARTSYVLLPEKLTVVERSFTIPAETTAHGRSIDRETTAETTARMTAPGRARSRDEGETKSLPIANEEIEWLALGAEGVILGRFDLECEARAFAGATPDVVEVEQAIKQEPF